MHLFRFLPGAYCVQTDTRGIVTDDESKTLIFEYLYKELTMRAQEKRSYPHLLIFSMTNTDIRSIRSHSLQKKEKIWESLFVFRTDTRGHSGRMRLCRTVVRRLQRRFDQRSGEIKDSTVCIFSDQRHFGSTHCQDVSSGLYG